MVFADDLKTPTAIAYVVVAVAVAVAPGVLAVTLAVVISAADPSALLLPIEH